MEQVTDLPKALKSLFLSWYCSISEIGVHDIVLGGTGQKHLLLLLMGHDLSMKNPEAMKKAQEEEENMRSQPPAPLLNGYEIPAETLVYVNAWAIRRDPKAWKNPFELSSTDLKGSDFELIPFGAGRRICPGIFIGLATVELSLANLLHKFDWEMPSGTLMMTFSTKVQTTSYHGELTALLLAALEESAINKE
eukprot:XP_024457607.1 cytochrome P450 71B37-like [Populus trichocarpa]